MATTRATIALLALALVVGTANARTLQTAKPAATTFATWTDGVKAATAAGSPITTFMAAVQAAGVADALKPGTAWTILAPTNEAFERRLKRSTNLTPADLLKPANKELLVKVLSYHVIPAGAVTSTMLRNNMAATTALAGAKPLAVKLSNGGVAFKGAGSSARVVTPNIRVGASVVHVIDDVLLPEGLGTKKEAGMAAAARPAATAAPMMMAAGR